MQLNCHTTLFLVVLTIVQRQSNGAPNPGVTLNVNIDVDTSGQHGNESKTGSGGTFGGPNETLKTSGRSMKDLGIVPCFREMGLTDACIKIFSRKTPLGEPNSNEIEKCEKWAVENKESNMFKTCMALGNSPKVIHGKRSKSGNCADCHWCALSTIFVAVCDNICRAAKGCSPR